MRTQDARIQLRGEIARSVRTITDLENKIRLEQDRIEANEKLLGYCTCEKCGSELQGGVWDAQEMMEAALVAGRKDYPCPHCDTPEQKAAMEKALDMVAR